MNTLSYFSLFLIFVFVRFGVVSTTFCSLLSLSFPLSCPLSLFLSPPACPFPFIFFFSLLLLETTYIKHRVTFVLLFHMLFFSPRSQDQLATAERTRPQHLEHPGPERDAGHRERVVQPPGRVPLRGLQHHTKPAVQGAVAGDTYRYPR